MTPDEDRVALSTACALPRIVRADGRSPHAVLLAGGVTPANLRGQAVRQAIEADPELVTEWRRWSEEKRTTYLP